MLKKTITYTDYDGNTRSEDFYFNLTKRELTELNLKYPDANGFQGYIERLEKEQDNLKIYETIKDLIIISYGEKSPDGKHFYKSEKISDDFASTMAFEDLIMGFFGATDEEAEKGAQNLADFIHGVIPKDIRDSATKG